MPTAALEGDVPERVWDERPECRLAQSIRTGVDNVGPYQSGTNNCWAFAATALVEAMVRIEHLLWSSRSEGDMVHGVGKQSWDLGNLGEAIAFVEKNGLADPDCFPFGVAAALYTAQESNQPVTFQSPTPDREGRTVRLPAGSSVSLTDPAQKKQWIDQVGPMATMITPPIDFGSLGSQVYVPTTTVLGGARSARRRL